MARLNNEISKERIKALIEQKCGGSQSKFAELCGIGKYSVSQYVHGQNSPGNVTAVKISRVFGVDPLWVMGEPDAPMYKDTINQSMEMTEYEQEMLMKYRALPPYYRKLIDDMILSLTESTAKSEAIFTPKDVLSDD